MQLYEYVGKDLAAGNAGQPGRCTCIAAGNSGGIYNLTT
jgi:hypothetical protein